MRLAVDIGRHAHEHRLPAAAIAQRAIGHQPLQALDLIEVVHHDQAHPVAQRHAQLRV